MGGQSFREAFIWTLPVDDLFRANIDNVTRLHRKYSVDLKKNIDLNGCLTMMEGLQVSDDEIN